MNININLRGSHIGAGFSAVLGCLSWRTAAAADGGEGVSDWLLWLYGLPEWISALVLSVIFSGLSLLALSAYRRWRRTDQRKPLADYSTALGGAMLGVAIALLSAGVWKSYLLENIVNLAPTATGLSQPPADLPLDLLEAPDPASAAIPLQTPKKVLPGRARHATVNFSAIDADTLNLNLFDDTILVAVRDRIVKDMQGGSVWVGHIDGEPDSEVILAAKGKALMGTVETGGRSFEIVYVGGDTHAVREIDPNKTPAKFEPDVSDSSQGASNGGDAITATSSTTSTAADTASTGQTIDVLVVYTPKASSNAGGDSGIQSKIINAVTKANQAYLNSQIGMQLNLVYMGVINYTETGDMTVALPRLQGTADGYMDDVHALRNQYAADQVVLVDADSNYCGYANIMTSVSTNFASMAFAVLHDDSVYNCLGSNNSFAHELGHNQGNVHNSENTSIAGAYPDSYGYRICGLFRDIMSYPCSTEIRIPYFSNPNVLYNGQPTGIVNFNDTARSMNATAATVASFRTSTVTATVPNAPGNLAATVASTSGINLAWADNASNETGYYVQRSPDGTTWSLVATLGSNAVSFSDSGLNADTTYDYRVYAYNSVGNSGFSNTASAKTNAVVVQVADTTAPAVSISNPSQGVKIGSPTQTISVSAADNTGVSSLKLYIDGKLVGSANTGSLSYSWNTKKVAAGTHTINAQAADAAGNNGSTSISVTK